MSDLDLRDLAAFAAVARMRNFRRAATEQHVSVSSLSQRLRDMEERLGVRLINRTTRSVALTEAGELLLSRIGPAMRDVGDALDQVRGLRGVPSGRLRINAPPPAIDLVLAPMVAPFLKRYPEIDLEIVTDSSLIDIVSEGFDAGIRYEETLAQDMVAISLGPPERYALVAAPSFLKGRKRPAHPNELLDQPCIVTRFRSGVQLPWEFRKGKRAVKIMPTGPLTAAHPELQLQAAIDGLGIAMGIRPYIDDDLAAGRLVAPFALGVPKGMRWYLVYRGFRTEQRDFAAFRRWIIRAAAEPAGRSARR